MKYASRDRPTRKAWRFLPCAILWAGCVWIAEVSGAESGAPPSLPQSPTVTPPASTNHAPEVGPVPTPQPVVDKMLEMARIGPGDTVYDLGCGDGRILVTAAKRYGVKAVGVDLDPMCVKEALDNARTNGVAHLVTVRQADVFEVDFSEATVVTLYLLPSLNVRLMPKLACLRPGTRILSHDFDMKGAIPAEVHRMTATFEPPPRTVSQVQARPGAMPPLPPARQRTHTIYKWVVPWEKDPGVQAPGVEPVPRKQTAPATPARHGEF